MPVVTDTDRKIEDHRQLAKREVNGVAGAIRNDGVRRVDTAHLDLQDQFVVQSEAGATIRNGKGLLPGGQVKGA